MKLKGFMSIMVAMAMGVVGAKALPPRVSNANDDHVNRVENPQEDDFVPGEVLVKFKDTSPVTIRKTGEGRFKSASRAAVNDVLANYGVTVMDKLFPAEKHRTTLRKVKAMNGSTVQENNLDQIFHVKIMSERADSVRMLVEALSALDEVQWAEPNYRVYITGAVPEGLPMASPVVAPREDGGEAEAGVICPNPRQNPLYSQQWGIRALNVDALWNKPVISYMRPIIAILDTGVDITHPDLKDNIWTNELEANGEAGYDDDGDGFVDDIHGWDFVYNYNEMDDRNSHGTHCAGIAAAADNGLGIVGANPRALIMPVKVMDDDGTGNIATIVKGINYAAARGADVISMSFGGGNISNAEIEALENAYITSVLVASAGNNAYEIYNFRYGLSYPAAYYCVLGTQSTFDTFGHLSPFSNYDPDGPVYSRCDISLQLGRVRDPGVIYGINYEVKAPGSLILSTVPGGKYALYSGTSMAAPLLAGAISALKMVKDYGTNDRLMADLAHLDCDFSKMVAEIEREPEVFFTGFNIDDNVAGNTSIDGEVDAGETIKMTAGLLSGWGNTGNGVTLHLEVDTMKHPFVSIENPDIDFGYSLDAYSHMAAKEPFIVHFSDKCDNDAQVKFLLTVNCNGKSTTHEHYMGIKKYSKFSGMLTCDTTLTADRVWYINDNVIIPKGYTLTIEPGTTLKFAKDKSLESFGKLVATGTPEKPIIMTREGDSGYWYGVFSHENEDGYNFGENGFFYCNADTTKFTIRPTEETNIRITLSSLIKRVTYYYNPDEQTELPDNQWIYFKDYFDRSDFTRCDSLLSNPDYLTPIVNKFIADYNELINTLDEKYSREWFKDADYFSVFVHTTYSAYIYQNPIDELSYCKLYYLSYLQNIICKNCEIIPQNYNIDARNSEIYSSQIKGSLYDNNSYVATYSNFIGSYQKNRTMLHLPSLSYCNVLPGSSYRRDFITYYKADSPTVYTPEQPSYLGSSREDLVRPRIYDFNTGYYYGIVDLSNMPDRPYKEAHGVLWKVVVDGKDAQDEFEEMDPVGVGEHKVEVYFNRAMNVAKKPTVSYGMRKPFTQHTLDEGTWSADSTVYTTTMKITGRESSDGLCRFYVRGAEDNEYFECPEDSFRYNMTVQAAGSMATGFMATPALGRVELEWNNDHNDFSDAMGFNVYRYGEPYKKFVPGHYDEKGNWINEDSVMVADTLRLNKQMLEITTTSYVDYDVKPGKTYYYYYKVLSTDLKEYDISNVVACTPLTSTLGDANGSGEVDVADVVTVVDYSVGEQPKPFIFEAADVNADRSINILDVVGIVKLILGNTQIAEAGVAAVAQYSIENGTLYVESPVELAGVQVLLNLPDGAKPTVTSDLAGFETASATLGGDSHIFLAYSMSGATLTAGRHALLHLGEGTVAEMALSDRNGSNVLAIEAHPDGVQTPEALRLERPYPTPFVDTLNIPYVIGNDGANEVEIIVNSIVGSEVHHYTTTVREAGRYTYCWTPGIIDSGFYFVTLRVNGINCQSVKVIYEK